MPETEHLEKQLDKIEHNLDEMRSEIDIMKNNHLHHLELRLTKLETSISVGWKAVIFGAGIPAIISAILSVVQMMK
jgi:demethoxyubiquinone hydroxylase (CLK1/Coq7/Cat5 family)|tara:strand:+ start:842 stop:1069 length:228 start_codon:yes stop_codon:yes gene_type:complete